MRYLCVLLACGIAGCVSDSGTAGVAGSAADAAQGDGGTTGQTDAATATDGATMATDSASTTDANTSTVDLGTPTPAGDAATDANTSPADTGTDAAGPALDANTDSAIVDAGAADATMIDGAEADATPSVCGNGVIEGDEECDDQNEANDDACVACRAARCGDGVRRGDVNEGDPGYERCDDGDDDDWNACSNDCQSDVGSAMVLHHSYDDQMFPVTDLAGDHAGVPAGRAPEYVAEADPRGGAALSFPDGRTHSYAVPTLREHNWGQALTVSLWIRWEGSAGAYRAVVGNGYFQAGSFEVRFGREQRGTRLALRINTEDASRRINVIVPAEAWHHVAMTYDGASMRAYLDGELQAEEPLTGEINRVARSLEVGRNAGDGSEPYSGQVDDLRIYNVAVPVERLPIER